MINLFDINRHLILDLYNIIKLNKKTTDNVW